MMKAISFNYTQNHDVVSWLVVSKNQLKDHLCTTGATDVSDDERLHVAPPANFGFPSGLAGQTSSTRLVVAASATMTMSDFLRSLAPFDLFGS